MIGLIAIGGISHLALDVVAHRTPLLYPVSLHMFGFAPSRTCASRRCLGLPYRSDPFTGAASYCGVDRPLDSLSPQGYAAYEESGISGIGGRVRHIFSHFFVVAPSVEAYGCGPRRGLTSITADWDFDREARAYL